jgi:hypothetical protein
MPQDASALERDPYDRVLILGEPHVGKASPLDEPVLTPHGYRPIGSLRIDDEVIGSDGCPTCVTGVFPQGVRPIFRVTLDDGASTRVCAEHLWLTKRRSDRQALDSSAKVRTTVEIASSMRGDAPSGIHYLPRLSAPVIFRDRQAPLPIDPYYLGLLLGDGCMASTAPNLGYTSADDELIAAVERGAREMGDEAIPHREPTFTWVHFRGPNTRAALEKLELYGCVSQTKFVPSVYLHAAPAERLALLRGLCDTDGTISEQSVGSGGTTAVFISTSERLRDAVAFLVRSLGGRARIRPFDYALAAGTGTQAWLVRITFDDETIPFALPRKAARMRFRTKSFKPRIVAIEPYGESECVCISVAAEDHLYVTNDFIVTHNSTSVVSSAAEAFGMGYVLNCGKKSGLTDAARQNGKFKWDLVRDEMQMEEAIKEARRGAKDGTYKWIVIDDYSMYASWLEVALEDQTRNVKGESDGRRFWREYRKRLINVLVRCFDFKAHVYVISHFIETGGMLIDGQTEKTGVGIAPLFAGAARKEIPGMFGDIVFMAPNTKDRSKRSFFINPVGVYGPSCLSADGTSEIDADVGALHEEFKKKSKAPSPKIETKRPNQQRR